MKNTEIISVSLPKGYGQKIDKMAKNYSLSRSKFIELILRGIIQINTKGEIKETKCQNDIYII